MTYGRLPKTAGEGYFVLERRRSASAGVVSFNDYVDDPAQAMIHGRLSTTDATVGGLRTSTGFAYKAVGLDLEEERVVTGHDGATARSSRRFCTLTQRLVRTLGDGEAEVAFTYDITGRVKTQTVAPGAQSAATRAYAYAFAQSADGLPVLARLEETDAEGLRYVTRYDGLGRLVAAAEMTPDASERRIKAIDYDRLGRRAAETVYDQLDDRELALTTRYVYGDWGEIDRTIRPDGAVTLSMRNPVANTLTTGVEGLSVTVNRYNDFEKVIEIVRVSTAGARVKTLARRYDGFGRCTSLTNVDGHVTEYGYDTLDRVVEVRMTPVDRTAPRTVTTAYAPFSSAALPIEVRMNGGDPRQPDLRWTRAHHHIRERNGGRNPIQL